MSDNKLTEENIEAIDKVMEDNVENSEELKMIKDLPSNNDIEETENKEKGEYKLAHVLIDPETGENKILNTEDPDTVDSTTFEELVAEVEAGKYDDIKIDDSPITEDELKENIDSFNMKDDDKFNLSDEATKELLEIANRRMNKEEFNVYKAFPDEIKKMVDDSMGLPKDIQIPSVTSNEMRALRNQISESLIDDFILNISMQRAKMDLNNEIQNLYKEGIKDLAAETIGYTQERNQKYREYVNNMEDEEKKAKLTETLDTIDSAYTLEPLKEFAKTCKIKRYDIENPKNYFRDFLTKYQNSSYNIYDIKLTLPILERKIVDNEKYNNADVIAFLVCFCKYIRNFKAENILEHSFMYYVIYNIVVMDANTAESTKEVSEIFANNIREVMNNLKERNPMLK